MITKEQHDSEHIDLRFDTRRPIFGKMIDQGSGIYTPELLGYTEQEWDYSKLIINRRARQELPFFHQNDF